MSAEVCDFSYKAGYDQAVIDDKAKLVLALDVIKYLHGENARLKALLGVSDD